MSERRWRVTKSECSDGVAWIVKTPGRPWEYTPFWSEGEAQDYAIEMNDLDARRDVEALLAEEPRAAAEEEVEEIVA